MRAGDRGAQAEPARRPRPARRAAGAAGDGGLADGRVRVGRQLEREPVRLAARVLGERAPAARAARPRSATPASRRGSSSMTSSSMPTVHGSRSGFGAPLRPLGQDRFHPHARQRARARAALCSSPRSRPDGQSSPWGRGQDTRSKRLVLAVPVHIPHRAVHSALWDVDVHHRSSPTAGGGFSMEPGNPLLDEYVLSLCRRKKPRVCFFPSASGDADHYVVRFYRHFSSDICDPSHISLFRRDCGPGKVREHLLKQDLIYVGGGSILSLLGVWRAHGIDEDLRAAWRAGVILVGVSAGSLCWFASGLTAYHHDAKPYEGLGFLPHSNAVHYEEESNRRPAYHAALLDGTLPGGYARLGRRGTALRRRGPAPGRALAPGGAGVPGRGGRRRGRGAPAGGDLSRRTAEDHPCRRLNGRRRSSPWAGAASRWSRRTPPSTTTCSSLADSATLPRICLLPTASGDGEAQIRQFHATFGARACEPMHISLFRLGSRPIPLRETLLDQHIIYVGGGSMLGLLAVWRALGLDVILREAWESGVVLAGLSRRRDVLVRVGRHEVARPPGAVAGPRLPARLDVRAHGRRAGAAAGLPRGDRRRHDPARLRRRRRRRAAVPRHRARGGRHLAPEPPRAAHRPGRRGASSSRACSPRRRPLRPDARDRRVPPRARAHRPQAPSAHQLRPVAGPRQH